MNKINDKVKIGKSADESNPIELKYIGKTGVIVGINENDAPSIRVRFESGRVEAFWPEELETI